MKVTVTDAQLRSWRLRGFTVERIAKACGWSVAEAERRVRQVWVDTQQQAAEQDDPTPEVIRERCEEIQATWTEAERERRRVVKTRRWMPAVTQTPSLLRDFLPR